MSDKKWKIKKHILSDHSGQKIYKCSICEKSFLKKEHTLKCQKKPISKVHEKKKPYKCSVCKKGFDQEKSLKQHNASVHEGKNLSNVENKKKICRTKKIECHFCFQTFGRRYEKHVASCLRYKKLITNNTTCIICDRSFDCISTVYRHIG